MSDVNENKKWWLQEKIRIFKVTMTNDPATDVEYDPEDRAELIASTGANLTEINLGGGGARIGREVYFKTELPMEMVEDRLAGWIKPLHQRGVKVSVQVNVHAMDGAFAQKHPEFAQHTQSGKPYVLYGSADTAICPNSPHSRQFFKTMHADLLKYEIDGIFDDGLPFFLECCYCPYCREKFSQQYGKELPPKDQIHHPDMPDMISFQRQSIRQWQQELADHIRSIRSDVFFSRNVGAPMGLHIRLGKTHRDMAGIMDFVYPETALHFHPNNPLLRGSFGAKLSETQVGGKCVAIMGFMYKPKEYSYLPVAQILLNCASLAANGANTWVATRIVPKPQFEALRGMYLYQRANDKVYSNTRSIAEVAIVWPEWTVNFNPQTELAKEDMEGGVEAGVTSFHGNPVECFFGAGEVLWRNNVAYDVIDEQEIGASDINDRYKMIILPNATNLSDEHLTAIRNYVKNGGTLITSHQTAMCDEYGKVHDRLTLCDLFGVDASGQEIGERKNEHCGPAGIATDHEVTGHLQGLHMGTGPNREKWMGSPYWILDCKATSGDVLLYHSEKARGRSGSGKPPKVDQVPMPALIHNKVGAGQVFYFNGLFFEDYRKFERYEFRELIDNMVNYIEAKPVWLDKRYPAVEVVLRKRNDGAIIVHLVNHTGQMNRPIEDVVPFNDMTVSVRLDRDIKEVRACKLGKNLEYSISPGIVEIALPRLEIFESIVIE